MPINEPRSEQAPSSRAESAGIAASFLARYVSDEAAGEVRDLPFYLGLFPGHETLVEREYLRLQQSDPTTASAVTAASAVRPNAFGAYRIIRELGRGGQSVVYLAEDTRMHRRVALKVMPVGQLPSEKVRLRFRREAEIAAKLDHPGICGVLDIGDVDGIPFIAMRYVRGETLAAKIHRARVARSTDGSTSFVEVPEQSTSDPRPLPRPRRAGAPKSRPEIMRIVRLIEQTARALHAAHESGLVHRDVKPGNVIVTPDGDPIVLDFGLAVSDAAGVPSLTPTGDLMGTPAYMSPEQLASHIRLDRRTDIYSLGVTLYECLLLRRPFDAPTRDALYRQILAADPEPPRRANPGIPRDLEVVLATAMEKGCDRRYQTALDFADDLRRVREYEPIRARPAGVLRRLRRWTQRAPAVAGSVLTAFLALVIGLVMAVFYAREKQQRNLDLQDSVRKISRADAANRRNLDRYERLRLSSQSGLALNHDPDLALLLAIEGARRKRERVSNNALYAALGNLAKRLILIGHQKPLRGAAFGPAGGEVLTYSDDGTVRTWSVESGEEIVRIAAGGAVGKALFDPSGRIIAAAVDRDVLLFDSESGRRLARLTGHRGVVNDVAFSHDGARLVSASGSGHADAKGDDVRIWDVASGAAVHVLSGHEGDVYSACFSPDGELVVSGGRDGTMRLWSVADGELLDVFRARRSIFSVSFSPDGETAMATTAQTGILWDVETGEQVATLGGVEAPGSVTWATFDQSGRWVLSSPTATIQGWTIAGGGLPALWDAETGATIMEFGEGEAGRFRRAALSRDGSRVATSSVRGIEIVDIESGHEIHLGHYGGDVVSLTFSPDGGHLLTASDDGTASLWSVGHLIPTIHAPIAEIELSPSGRLVALLTFWGTVHLLETATLHEVRRFGEARPNVVVSGTTLLDFSPDERRLIVPRSHDTLEVRDLADGRVITSVTASSNDQLFRAEFDRDGGRILASSLRGPAWLYDAANGNYLGLVGEECPSRFAPRFTPDGRHVFVPQGSEGASFLDSRNGRLARRLPCGDGAILAADFDGTGRRLVTHSVLRAMGSSFDDLGERAAELWDAETGERIARLQSDGETVVRTRFSGGGRYVVTCTLEKGAAVWDARDGHLVSRLRGHRAPVVSAAFSPDGDRVVTASEDRSCRVWDVRSGEEVATIPSYADAVVFVAYTADGESIVTATRSGDIRVLPTDPLEFARAHKPRDLTPDERDRYEIGSREEREAYRRRWNARYGIDG